MEVFLGQGAVVQGQVAWLLPDEVPHRAQVHVWVQHLGENGQNTRVSVSLLVPSQQVLGLDEASPKLSYVWSQQYFFSSSCRNAMAGILLISLSLSYVRACVCVCF